VTDPYRYALDRATEVFLPHTRVTVNRGGDGLFRIGETVLDADTWETARTAAERHVLDAEHGVRVTKWSDTTADDSSALFVTGVAILQSPIS